MTRRLTGLPLGLPRGTAVVLLLVLLAVRQWDPLPVEVLRLRTFDIYQNIYPRERATAPVTIVDIDEASLNAVGQWPWPRTKVAELIDRIYAAGADAVAFDMIFAEPDRLSPPALSSIIDRYDGALARKLADLPSNDALMARTMRDTGSVVLAQALARSDLAHDTGPVYQPSVATLGEKPHRHLISAPGMIRNVPVLADAAAGIGVITLSPSVDAVVRKVPLFFGVRGTAYPSLALELMRAGGVASSYVIESDPSGIQRVLLGERQIPVDERGQFWVWYGHSRPETFVPAHNVLAGTVAPSRLRERLVLVGTSATGLGDIRATPVDGAVPGVEVHAQIVESVLGDEILSRPAGAKLGEMILTAIVAVGIIVLTPRYGPVRTLVMGGVAAATIAGSSAYAFLGAQLLIDPSFPLLASLILFGWLAMGNYIQEERQKRFIRRAFGQYLAPSMVENLSQDPTALRLGGETRDLTVMFCDLRGFTRLSERYANEPQNLTRLLNRFLTPLSYAVLDYNGTIDKYIGDAVMAFWNAPLDDPDHAVNATSAALRITEAVDDLNQALTAEAQTHNADPVTLQVAIGLNTGPCVAGNLGSDVRFNYSAIGDTVNVAARLEGLTRMYGIDIIVGERTAIACSDNKLLLPLDRVRVKGKMQPERIHTVLGMRQPDGHQQAFDTLLMRHEQVLAGCEAGDWARAREALAIAQPNYEAFGLTTLAAVYAERVERLRANPKAAHTDGIFDATQKTY